jgi:GrpB-like predicted nucleotidyltransferase (UPF0157 family)
MSKNQIWRDGLLIREDDDTARTVTEWDAERNPTTRPYTAPENTEADRRVQGQAEVTNELSIRDKLRLALAANADYLALTTPTAAQTTVQVKSLTRQVTALIRLANRQLEADS